MKGDARKSFSLAELAGRFGGTVLGDAAVRIRQVAPLETAGPDELSFLTNRKYQKLLSTTRAAAVLLAEDSAAATQLPRIVCKNPYASYARIAALINPESRPVAGIHAKAVVDAQARVAASASVGPCAVIEQGADIGEEVLIGANCFVGQGVRIGAHSRLHPNATIYHDCVIGERVILHSGVVIGADGFGMAMDEGRWLKIPQIGRVVIGDDVEVGASTTIDRGALDDTVIEEGVKLDNQIQIGHNCHIGAHTAIAGCTGIAGSTRIGKYCMLGGNAMISGHLTIADRVVVSGGTLVAKSIMAPGTYTAVFPMLPHDQWLKNAALVRHLDEMMDRVRDLEDKMKKLGKGMILNAMEIQEIMEHLPHRYPMLLIDRVLSVDPGKEIIALKNVTINEPFFAGHFPHYPVMPGVLIVEAMAQAAAVLAFKTFNLKSDSRSVYYFVGIDEARFKKPVMPGDRLILKVQILRAIRGIWKFSAKALVDDVVVSEANLLCTMRANPGNKDSGNAAQ